ncbi:major facilitator superfamily domain-containing protein [Circinella umbellata]|nr:major facilitator superfamily domain-containing protein [Circinella umbellata]
MVEDDKTTIQSSDRSIVIEGISKVDLEKTLTQSEDQQIQKELDPAATDPRNPKNWSKLKKWRNFGIVFCNAFIGYFTSSIYMPAIGDLQQYFGTTLTIMNITIALYVLAMAIAPLFWSPLSERIGRRGVYIIAMAIYTVTTIICGISKNLVLFFVMRVLQGVFSSAGMTVGGGTVADLFMVHERGKIMSLLTLGTVTGPAVGPLVGGYIAKYLGWRWIFYICTIIGGTLFLANVLFLRESLYRPNEDGFFSQKNGTKKTIKERLAYLKFDPFRGLALLLHPAALLTCLPLSISFGWFYFLVAILSPTYSEIYHFDQGSLGLLYLTGVFFCLPVIIAGNLMYGWFIHARLHWFAPLVGYFLMSLGTMYGNVIGTSYLIEVYIHIAASALSTANFSRNLMAMVFTLISVPIRQGLGDGWAYTLSALISFGVYIICIPIVYFYAERLRNSTHKKN